MGRSADQLSESVVTVQHTCGPWTLQVEALAGSSGNRMTTVASFLFMARATAVGGLRPGDAALSATVAQAAAAPGRRRAARLGPNLRLRLRLALRPRGTGTAGWQAGGRTADTTPIQV
jgi:hypothetical protein